MPSVTREQVNKWNAKLQNGFRFDIQRYVVWGENQEVYRAGGWSDSDR